jgi:hypothetical protein
MTAPRPSDHLVAAAEALIVRGKEQGYLTTDDLLAGLPEVEAEPDRLERIFHAFREMGIEVSDGDRDFENADEVDDTRRPPLPRRLPLRPHHRRRHGSRRRRRRPR